jgi:uncharacterized protein (TIGR02996 family)
MDQEQAFLQAMVEQPRDLALRLIFADWLEEQGDPRGELLRLTHLLTQGLDQTKRQEMEERLQALLAAGVRAVGPFWTNSLGMTFAWIPPGVGVMGSPDTEVGRFDDEDLHRVRITKGLWLGAYPVTQAQWLAVLGHNPSHARGDDLPVEQVSWLDCQQFSTALSKRDDRPYALPTEAEWEYACRAGTTTPNAFGSVLDGTLAKYNGDDHDKRTVPVGSYRPNAFGLGDMHGNVLEWCQDWYVSSLAASGEVVDPVTPEETWCGGHVVRGGSYLDGVVRCRSAFRGWDPPDYRHKDIGCRVCFRLD